MKPGAPFALHSRRSAGPAPAPPLAAATLLWLLLALLPSGCEWSDWGLGIGTGLHDSELRSRYDGTFHIEWEDRRGGGWDQGPGTVRLFGVGGSSIDGEWSWRLGPRRLSGRVRRGSVDFGRLRFALETGAGRDVAEALTGCRFSGGDRLFHGDVRGRALRADREVRLRCHDLRTGRSGDLFLYISFRGRR